MAVVEVSIAWFLHQQILVEVACVLGMTAFVALCGMLSSSHDVPSPQIVSLHVPIQVRREVQRSMDDRQE